LDKFFISIDIFLIRLGIWGKKIYSQFHDKIFSADYDLSI
jgi:hypothetical protein